MSDGRPMAQREKLFFGATICFLAMLSAPAYGADCTSGTRMSPCFDADTLWLPEAPTQFTTIPSPKAPPARTFSVGLGLMYLSRPVTLKALAPDPSGRTVLVVDDVLDASLVGSYAPTRHLELGLAIPMALYRTGTGLSGVTSQRGSPLTAAALRDVRIGAGYDIVDEANLSPEAHFSARSRLELALPTGDEDAFAGDRSPVLAPSVVLGLDFGPVRFGAEEGARLRSSTDFGGSRLGSQFTSSLGASAEVVPEGRLSLSIEAWIFPNFLSTSRSLPDGVQVTGGALVPAEWMATASSRISEWTLSLGGGSALPLSSETRRAPDGTETTEHFAGATSPRFRFVLAVRYSSR